MAEATEVELTISIGFNYEKNIKNIIFKQNLIMLVIAACSLLQ
jgi:hypothetical protein